MSTGHSRSEVALRAAQALLALNALIWVGLGVLSFIRISERGARSGTLAAVAVLMFGNAAAFLICAVGLHTGRRAFYWLTLAVLVANIVLTFTDQFGALDFVTLLIDLVALGLLFYARRHWPASPPSSTV